MLKVADIIQIKIDKIVFGGEGLGYYNGFAVFVPMSIPEDELEIEIISVKKTYARGLIKNIIKASPERIDSHKFTFEDFYGCDFAMLKYESQLKYKKLMVEEVMRKIAGLPDIEISDVLASEDVYNYRNKIIEPFSVYGNKIITGFFKRKSHEVFEVDENKKILNFEEKPAEPKSNLASMGIYIFNTEVLLEYLEKMTEEDLDFGKHVIPQMIHEERKVFVHCYDSYWMDVGTYDSYLDANLDLIKKSEEIGINLYDPEWKIYTRSEDLAPVRIGVTGSVLNSLICDGCKIEGRVENSVLGPGVTVRKGCTVKNSIIFSGTYIDENTNLDTMIIDKGVYVGKNSILGYGDDFSANHEKPDLLSRGISVIGKKAILPDGSIVGRNVRIFGRVKLHDGNKFVHSGETIKG